MYIFTDWPWETVSETIKHIITNRPADVEQERPMDNVDQAIELAVLADVVGNVEPAVQLAVQANVVGNVEPAVQLAVQADVVDNVEPAVQLAVQADVVGNVEPAVQLAVQADVVGNVEPAVQLAMQADVEQAQQAVGQPQRCSATCFLKWLVITSLRLFFILAGMSLQLITCFRRDLVSSDLLPIPNTTNTKRLSCDKKDEVVLVLLIPDCLILLVAIWVYVGLKFGHQCFKWLEWKELSTVTKADTAKILNNLVEAVKSKLSMGLLVQYSIFPLVYILLSQLVSFFYLIVFRLWSEDVIIQTPFSQHDLEVKSKRWLLASSFIGFIALDHLYVIVIMRYVYRCQMIIYYLQMIKCMVKPKEGKSCGHYKEAIDDVKKAERFIKYLNASSGTTGLITIIAVFQAANCTFVLLNNGVTNLEAGAIIARLILWGSLAIYPFYKAAGLNAAAKELCNTGLDMHIPHPKIEGHPANQGSGLCITLKAIVLGIRVRPWLPYLIFCIMLLTIMVGSKFNWFKVKL